MKPGDVVWVRVGKADGSPHRWWQARIESAAADCIVTYAPVGTPVYHNPTHFPRDLYHLRDAIRSYYWPGRRHTVLEVYTAGGDLGELYADITSPIEVSGGEIRYVDHELDVSQLTGEAARIVDQDEFAEAAARYGYSEAFIGECYALANELLALFAGWQPRGAATTD